MQTLVKWLNREKPHREFPLSDFERIRYELKPCDVLLIEGRSRVSDVIRLITQSPWSHAALYIGRLHDIEDPEIRAAIQEHARPEGVLNRAAGSATGVCHGLARHQRRESRPERSCFKILLGPEMRQPHAGITKPEELPSKEAQMEFLFRQALAALEIKHDGKDWRPVT